MSSIYDYMTNILVYDKNYKRIGTLSNGGANPQAPYYDDLFIQELDTGADTFQFSAISNKYTQDLLEIGNHVGFIYKNRFEVFTITSLEYSHYEGYKTIGVYAEGIGFELLDVFMERPPIKSYPSNGSNSGSNSGSGNSGGNDSDGDGDDNTDDEYADPDDVYIDENGNIIYDKNGSGPPKKEDVTIDGDGNIIYKANKKNEKNDSLEFKNISYPTFLNILLKNTGWSFVCQPGLESVKHNISVKYDTNIYAILQDSMQAFRGVELEFSYEGTPQNGGNSAAVRKVIKAYKDGGRGSFVGKRFEYGTNVRGITKTQEVTDSEDDAVLFVDNIGVEVYYDIDFALKSAEVPDLEIGDTHYVIDRDFCPPMTIKARIGKIEISFSDPTKNKITVANNKKIRGAAVDEEDINSTVKNLDDIINDGIDDYNDNYGDDDGSSGDCIKNGDFWAELRNLQIYASILMGDGTENCFPSIHLRGLGNALNEDGSSSYDETWIYPDLVATTLVECTRVAAGKEMMVGGWYSGGGYEEYYDDFGLLCVANGTRDLRTDILPNKIRFANGIELFSSPNNSVHVSREDGDSAKLSVFGELYVTEGIKCELTTETNTLDVNTIRFSDGTEMTTAGSGNNGGNSTFDDINSDLIPSTDSKYNLGIDSKRWNAGCINEIFSKGMETNRIESCLYLLPFDSEDMNSVKQITDSSGISKQDLLDFITNEINVYEYIYTGDCNPDAGESGQLFNSINYLGVLSKDFKSNTASLIMNSMTSNDGAVSHNVYNLPSLVTALIGAFQQHVKNGGDGGDCSICNYFSYDDTAYYGSNSLICHEPLVATRLVIDGDESNGLVVRGDSRVEIGNIYGVDAITFSDGTIMTTAGGSSGGGGNDSNTLGTYYVDRIYSRRDPGAEPSIPEGEIRFEEHGNYLYFIAGREIRSYCNKFSILGDLKVHSISGGGGAVPLKYIKVDSDIKMPNYCIECKELTQSSDKSLKENIRYIDDLVKLTNDDLLDKADLHDFIVNQVNLCEYNFIGDTSNKIGFIANDYEGTKVGDKIVSRNEENNTLTYSPDNLLFATIGALQEEVRMRDAQIASLEARLAAIEEMLNNK